MSELIDSLHRRGLPRADDDDYFIREVKEALSEIREWSRLMCRGSSSTSAEDFRQFYSHFKDILVASIDGVEKIVEGSEEIPGKLKTRCVEVVLYRTLLEKYLLGDTIIGLSSLSKERMEQLKNDMSVEQPQNDMSVSGK